MTSVLVSHPHAAAFANGAAAAFAGADQLSAYVTGAAAAAGTYRARQVERLAKRLPIVANRAAGAPTGPVCLRRDVHLP
jgi:hypothetical protein